MIMLIRCAFFEGRVKPGCDDAFAAFVKDRLVPLWTKFPGAAEVRVLRQSDSDSDEPHYAMVLSIAYPNLAAMELALASDVRAQSRVETGELIKMFEGRIFHTVFEVPHVANLV
jgi:antibiotic biosynthesis monooxygenase (ABM) superfamily enzyme